MPSSNSIMNSGPTLQQALQRFGNVVTDPLYVTNTFGRNYSLPVYSPPAVATPMGSDVGALYGMDNVDAGGGWNPAAGGNGAMPMGLLDTLKGYLPSGFLGSYDAKTGIKTDGWGGLALGAAQGIGSLFMGMQQYNLAKQTLENNKAQFERNFAAQRTTTNAALEDRQRARVASNPGAYQSVGDYMSQNGVK